jgi:hypothetical protein
MILNMDKRIYYLILIIVALGLEANGQNDYGVGDPYEIGIASANANKVHLDTITMNDTAYHTFKIKNIGNGDLKFVKVECDYGCNVVEYTTDSIAPGNIGLVKVAVFYYNRLGSFKKAVNFNCDGKFKYQQFLLEGFIKEY